MIQIKPGTKQEVLLSPEYMAMFNDEPVNEGRRSLPVLPLDQVLRNVEQLHSNCNGHHVCGLPLHLQKFDLNNYLRLSRAGRKVA